MSSQSLWADLSGIEKVRTPRTILLEQAEFLLMATEGVLVARVDDLTVAGRDFRYALNIFVPALNGYMVTVLTVRHGIDLYPVQVLADRPTTQRDCADEASFVETLRSILSSPELKAVLSRLLSQVT